MNKSNKNTEIELKLFNQIEKTKNHTQRSISKELNIALGLSNALIKKFLNKHNPNENRALQRWRLSKNRVVYWQCSTH